MDKITDWAELVSDRIVDAVECYMTNYIGDNGNDTVANALECVLSSTMAGPKAIALAKSKLGIVTEE